MKVLGCCNFFLGWGRVITIISTVPFVNNLKISVRVLNLSQSGSDLLVPGSPFPERELEMPRGHPQPEWMLPEAEE